MVTFGPCHVVQPLAAHTHTAIMLHGRGSGGEEFADELFDTTGSNGESLAANLPEWKWVFPSSPSLWSTAFQEDLPAWFKAHSLTDITAREDLQKDGIRTSANYICGIIDSEILLLDGMAHKVILGGISQGSAVGLWALLCQPPERRLGAFVASSTWFPLGRTIDMPLAGDGGNAEQDSFALDMLNSRGLGGHEDVLRPNVSKTVTGTPIFLGHGTDDGVVDIGLGRGTRDILARLGFHVEWKEYTGAEQEGHWFKEPEQVDDILKFVNSLPR